MDKNKMKAGVDEITRRDFIKFCSAVAVAIGMGPGAAREVAAALTSASRPPVLWLHFAAERPSVVLEWIGQLGEAS